MSDKKHYRDRVDVRFDDRFRFNRHREGAEKKRSENCVEHAGGEIIITILNHICTSSSRNVYYVTRAEFWWYIDGKKTLLERFFFWGISNSKSSFNIKHFAY